MAVRNISPHRRDTLVPAPPPQFATRAYDARTRAASARAGVPLSLRRPLSCRRDKEGVSELDVVDRDLGSGNNLHKNFLRPIHARDRERRKRRLGRGFLLVADHHHAATKGELQKHLSACAVSGSRLERVNV